MDVFILWHVYELEDDFGIHDEEKMIGIFQTEADAEKAIDLLKDQEGFRDHPLQCFEIHKIKIGQIGWTEGFSTVRF